MRRARAAALIALVALVAAGVLDTGVSGSDASSQAFSSERHSFEGTLPVGWQRSDTRLVPLLMPREILSVGTFPMPAGGGGNCGREPVAAIARMERGDALVSIQEYTVSAAMRERLQAGAGPPSLHGGAAAMTLRRRSLLSAERGRGRPPLWSTTLPFSSHGRWFDALVYVRARPTPERLRQVRAILEGLRFRAG
jgi:hypothetical protein